VVGSGGWFAKALDFGADVGLGVFANAIGGGPTGLPDTQFPCGGTPAEWRDGVLRSFRTDGSLVGEPIRCSRTIREHGRAPGQTNSGNMSFPRANHRNTPAQRLGVGEGTNG